MIGKPILLTGRYIDMPLSFHHIEAVAKLAPPEHVPQKPKKGRTGNVIDRARQYLSTIEPAVSGQHGQDATYRAACILVIDFDLSVDDAMPLMQEFNQRCQPPWDDDGLERKLLEADKSTAVRGRLLSSGSDLAIREVKPFDYKFNTFEPLTQHESSLDATFDPYSVILPSIDDDPLVDEEDPLAKYQFTDIESDSKEVAAFVPQSLRTVDMSWMDVTTQEGLSDVANAKRLATMAHNRCRYVVAWESWIIWDGKRWKADNLSIMELAKEVPGTIIGDAFVSSKPGEAVKWAGQSMSRSRLESMVKLAKSEPGVAIDHNELDSDPFLLNCQNGIVDLRTGELSPHDPSKLITRITNVDYDPDAESYDWDRFLESIFADESLITCVQRLIGYCCTGSTREQVLPIFWGEGSNGKSTLLDAVKLAIGTDYASTAPPSLLLQKKSDSHPTELAGLFGKRFVTSIETEKNQRLNEPLVKQLTGGDAISARKMRQDFWEFMPTHKIILCTNHEPRVSDDYAIWRRLVMIPFTVQFWNPEKGESGPPELQRDNDLPERLKRCLKGILAWAVRGAVEWYKNGLEIDDRSKAATASYRERHNYFGRFVDERCLTGEQYRVKFSDLYEKYVTWSEEEGEKVSTKKSFGEWLASKKFEKHRSNGIWVLGITWKPEYDTEVTFE